MKDTALLDEFKKANDAVIAALADYKKWLQADLLTRSTGEFAFGEDTYRRKLAADGSDYSLRTFHDSFIELGPLPLPLIRKAMLGEVGQALRF